VSQHLDFDAFVHILQQLKTRGDSKSNSLSSVLLSVDKGSNCQSQHFVRRSYCPVSCSKRAVYHLTCNVYYGVL